MRKPLQRRQFPNRMNSRLDGFAMADARACLLASDYPVREPSEWTLGTVKQPSRRRERDKAAVGDIMDVIHGLPPAHLEPQDCAYNLFRNRQRPEILCAVPEDRPLPGFLRSEQWTYERPLRSWEARPRGFHGRAAHAGVRFNGFYLFQSNGTGRQTGILSDLAA